MKAPIWYTTSESFLLHHGRPAILLALVVLLLITVYFAVRVYRGKSLVPAAFWATYLWMP